LDDEALKLTSVLDKTGAQPSRLPCLCKRQKRVNWIQV